MAHQYKGPGRYIAICITSARTGDKGHYCKEFTVPDEEQYRDVPASWYFLNVEDGVAHLEAVYPEDVFAPLIIKAYTEGVDAGIAATSCRIAEVISGAERCVCPAVKRPHAFQEGACGKDHGVTVAGKE